MAFKKINKLVVNTWNMLQYLYDELNGKKFQGFDISNVNTIDELYAVVICRWCSNVAREGLYKEYVTIEGEELTSPKGQIDVQQSIVSQSRSRGALICNYDELSADVYVNHILKAALIELSADSKAPEWIKTELQKAIMLFNGVSAIDLTFVKWKTVKYDNSNIRYKHLIEVIRNYLFERKMVAQGVLDDNTRTYQLFKKQLAKWIRKEYGEPKPDDEDYIPDIVETIEEPFTLSSEPAFEYKINRTQKVVVVRTEEVAMMVCVRLQTKQVLEDSVLARQHMEELVGYMRDYVADTKLKTSGVILYVNVTPALNMQPIVINVVNDYTVGTDVVDLHDDWQYTKFKVNEAYKYFIARSKNKNSEGKRKSTGVSED